MFILCLFFFFSSPLFLSLATPSNCGDTLKALVYQVGGRKAPDGRASSPGYGKNDKEMEQWAIRSQVLNGGTPQSSSRAP